MLYLDIETTTWFSDPKIKSLPRSQKLHAMKFGLATTFDSNSGEWRTWYQENLVELGLYLEKMGSKTDIIGWNIIDFDFPVIENNIAQLNTDEYISFDFVTAYDLFFDIRKKTERWYKLEVVAQANLKRGKSADGEQAAQWIHSGEPELIRKAAEYCRDDVQLTYELHQILLSGKPLLLPARAERNEAEDIYFYIHATGHEVG